MGLDLETIIHLGLIVAWFVATLAFRSNGKEEASYIKQQFGRAQHLEEGVNDVERSLDRLRQDIYDTRKFIARSIKEHIETEEFIDKVVERVNRKQLK